MEWTILQVTPLLLVRAKGMKAHPSRKFKSKIVISMFALGAPLLKEQILTFRAP
jgi:hypothetical protein